MFNNVHVWDWFRSPMEVSLRCFHSRSYLPAGENWKESYETRQRISSYTCTDWRCFTREHVQEWNKVLRKYLGTYRSTIDPWWYFTHFVCWYWCPTLISVTIWESIGPLPRLSIYICCQMPPTFNVFFRHTDVGDLKFYRTFINLGALVTSWFTKIRVTCLPRRYCTNVLFKRFTKVNLFFLVVVLIQFHRKSVILLEPAILK